MYKIYFDVCCLNRPFDDQSQTRIRLESEAILLILVKIKSKREYKWLGSEVVNYEIEAIPDKEKLLKVKDLCIHIDETIILNNVIIERGKTIKEMGFNRYDALHLACAEKKKVDVFLTTDDNIIKKAKANTSKLKIQIMNPLTWLEENTL